PGLSVLWSTGASSPTISPIISGSYWATVNNGHCTASDTILLNFLPTPIVQLGSDTTLCQGDTLILNATATAATYLWDNGSTAPIRAVSQNGTYWVGVTANGCTGHDSISIDFIPLPPVNLGQDTSLCEGTLLNLSPGAIPLTASILWSTGASTHSISPIITGVYWLRVSIGSCEESDTILVEFRPLPHIDLGPDTILCDGDQLILDASWPGTQHLWSDGSTNPTLAVSQAGTYSVTATADGCSNQDVIDISMVYQPEVYLGEDTTICQGDEILLNAGNGFSTYLWNTGSIGNVLNAGAAGPYWVKVSNQCGEAADTFLLSTKDCEYTIFIPNAFTPWRQDGINDQFVVKATGIAEYYIIIFNRWGGQLYESHSIYEPWDGTYHGKRCPQSV
ncbi:MAG: gliding motility-associated C-terminal domain-containing protein, partial [Bacteroidales bacterium]|nr:gliding motility-associated C-terminal domain-containing protein [Bacteroidales bacterium]